MGERFGGRQKGTPNKTTKNVKEALSMAFDGIGGVEKLKQWAVENPTEFYKLWIKLLPIDVNHSGTLAIQSAKEMTDDQLAAIASRSSTGAAETAEGAPKPH